MMQRWRSCILVLLLALVGGSLACVGPADAGYSLTVINHSTQSVEVYVNGSRRGVRDEMIRPCSTQVYESATVAPRANLDIRVASAQGVTVFETNVTPVFEKGEARVSVSVPGLCTSSGPAAP
jgi:hypothetical protein